MDKGIVNTILTVQMDNVELHEKIEEFMKLLRKEEIELDKDVELLDEDYFLTESIFEEDRDMDDIEEQFLTLYCFENDEDEESQENIKDIF